MGSLPAMIFRETGDPTSLSLSARDQPGFWYRHLFSYSQKYLNTGEELMPLPDLCKISQFSMLLREGTGKQNDDPLTFVKLEKTGWSTVHNITENRRIGVGSVTLGQSDFFFPFKAKASFTFASDPAKSLLSEVLGIFPAGLHFLVGEARAGAPAEPRLGTERQCTLDMTSGVVLAQCSLLPLRRLGAKGNKGLKQVRQATKGVFSAVSDVGDAPTRAASLECTRVCRCTATEPRTYTHHRHAAPWWYL